MFCFKYYSACECLFLFIMLLLSNFQFMESNAQNLKTASEEGICDPIICPSSKKDLKYSSNQEHLIELMDIESTDDNITQLLSNANNKLFFVESSGRNYLTPRDGCAIESAVKNSGLDGYIIFAMTSPTLNILANNITCHIYQKFSGRNVYFLHINVDTFFKGTPIQMLHEKGLLKHEEKINTIVQYR